MKTVLKCLGTIIYSSIAGYILWLLFYWMTPFIMSFGWFMLILYIVIAGGLISQLISNLGMILLIPMRYLLKDCSIAKVINVLCMISFGFSAVRLPWGLDIEYGLLQYIIAASLSITFIVTYACMAFAPYSSDN